MVVKRVVSASCILLLLFSSSISPITPVKAETISTSWIDAYFEFNFLNGTHLDIKLRLDVHNITAYDRIYGADEIREVYSTEGGAFRLKVFDYSKEVLEKVFKGCKINLEIPPHEDASSLNVPADDDPYNPPVIFYIDGNITLDREFFGCDIQNIDDLVNGLLDMGGGIKYDFSFFAPPSWNISYVFRVPDYMSFKEVNGGVLSIDGKKVTWDIKNWKGEDWKIKSGEMILEEVNPTTLPHEENITADITFDMRKMYTTSINISLEIFSLDVSNVISYPDFVEGINVIPSDGIRLLLNTGLISPVDLQNLLETRWFQFENSFIESLEKNVSFIFCIEANTTTNCSSPYNTSHMDTDPPIRIIAHGDAKRLLDNLSTRSVLGILYSGGKIKLDQSVLDISKLEYPFEAKIILPDGKIYRWNKSTPLNTTLFHNGAPRYMAEKKERIVEIYVRDIDLDLIGLLTGKSSVVSRIDIKDRFLIYRVSTSELLSLPPWVELKTMNSDLLRLFVEEGIVDNGMNGLVEKRKTLSESLLSSIVKQNDLKVYLEEKGLKESLRWDKDITKMDDQKPVNISFSTTTVENSRCSFSFIPLSLTIANESMECFSVPGENITYRFIFPKGVKVKFDDSLRMSKIGSLEDGRKYIEMVFPGDRGLVSSTLYYSLELPPLMVFFVFLPLIIIFLIVVGIIIVLILLKRRIRPRRPRYKISDEQTDESR